MRTFQAILVATALLGAAEAGAQPLASRVTGVGNGTVRMEYAVQPGVCGNGRGNISLRSGTAVTTSSGGGVTSTRRRDEWEDECEPGPARIALDVAGGRVVRLRAYVGGRWRGTADRDLGAVPPLEASDFLLTLAERADAAPAKEAIFPAMLAEGAEPWPRLLTLAKDPERPRDVRNAAVFWVSQAASEKATEGLQEIVDDPSGDRAVRESAVFALSRRPADESVPALIAIARTHREPGVRRSAIFWLGQSKDPRAIRYFEEMLLRE